MNTKMKWDNGMKKKKKKYREPKKSIDAYPVIKCMRCKEIRFCSCHSALRCSFSPVQTSLILSFCLSPCPPPPLLLSHHSRWFQTCSSTFITTSFWVVCFQFSSSRRSQHLCFSASNYSKEPFRCFTLLFCFSSTHLIHSLSHFFLSLSLIYFSPAIFLSNSSPSMLHSHSLTLVLLFS